MGTKSPHGRSLDPEQLEKLQQRTKEFIRKASGKVNAFISFASEDLDEVNLLRGQAKNDSTDIEFNDRSVKEPFNSQRTEYIRRRILERIRQCSITIVYLSEKTASSQWVEWEIKQSLALGKRVVAMHKGSVPPIRLPKEIEDNNIPVVSWNQQELAKAIQNQSEDQ